MQSIECSHHHRVSTAASRVASWRALWPHHSMNLGRSSPAGHAIPVLLVQALSSSEEWHHSQEVFSIAHFLVLASLLVRALTPCLALSLPLAIHFDLAFAPPLVLGLTLSFVLSFISALVVVLALVLALSSLALGAQALPECLLFRAGKQADLDLRAIHLHELMQSSQGGLWLHEAATSSDRLIGRRAIVLSIFTFLLRCSLIGRGQPWSCCCAWRWRHGYHCVTRCLAPARRSLAYCIVVRRDGSRPVHCTGGLAPRPLGGVGKP
mmetsp:Transcript_10311/g.32046  ORF Transcript_10311/g.32046 Transcript_10311/m.32046 type:complete len:266 (+) Transcript_10311:77-874(+)